MVLGAVANLISSDLAIDLGTANTVVYACHRGVVAHEPSVVAIQERQDGNRTVVGVGRDAKEMIGKTPHFVSTVRPIRDGMVADSELTWLLLKHMIKQSPRFRRLGRLRIVLSMPASCSSVERRAMVETAEAAGADEVFLLHEPIAAALGAGLQIREPYGHMIVDIGGGTTDIAIISLADLVYSRTIRIGGDAMDAAVARFLRRKYQLEVGDQTAEWLKITLGSLLPAEPVQRVTVKGTDSVTGMPQAQVVSAADVREALLDPLERIITAILAAFETTPPELLADIVDAGITLTGGGSLLDGLLDCLQEALGLRVHLAENPMACVALGAARTLEETELRQHVAIRV